MLPIEVSANPTNCLSDEPIVLSVCFPVCQANRVIVCATARLLGQPIVCLYNCPFAGPTDCLFVQLPPDAFVRPLFWSAFVSSNPFRPIRPQPQGQLVLPFTLSP